MSYQSHMSYSMKKPLYIWCLMFCWVLSNWVTLVRYSSCFLNHKHVHVPSICYIPTLGISTTIHSTSINAPCLGDLSWTSLKKNKVRLWLSQKEKMACQEAWPKKKREKKGATMSQKKEAGMIRERKDITLRSKPYSSIHSYTCTFWSRLHDLFLLGSSLWLYNK